MSTIRWMPTTAQALNKSSGTMVIGSPGSGKALWDEEYVLTPVGVRKVKDIRVGHTLIGKNGKPTVVLGVYPQDTVRKMYTLTTEDNREIVGCSNHMFSVYTVENQITPITKTIGELYADADKETCYYYIDNNNAIQFTEGDMPSYSPYVAGVIASTIQDNPSILDDKQFLLPSYISPRVLLEVQRELRHEVGTVFALNVDTRSYRFYTTDMLGNKLPLYWQDIEGLSVDLQTYLGGLFPNTTTYVINSPEVRLQYIQGICDICAKVISPTHIRLSGLNDQMVLDLVPALRYCGNVHVSSNGDSIDVHGASTTLVTFFRASEQRDRLRKYIEEGIGTNANAYNKIRIKSIEETGLIANCTCFTVDAEDSQFIAGNCVVTHNTFFMLNAAANCIGMGQRVIAIDPKNDFAKLLNISPNVDYIDVNDITPGALNPFTFLDTFDATTLITLIEIICGKFDKADSIQVTPIAQDFITQSTRDGLYVDMQDVADYLYSRDNESAQAIGSMLKIHEHSKYGSLIFTRKDNVKPLRLSSTSSMVISLHGMPLPDYNKKIEEYSPNERLTSAIMYIITSKLLEILSTPNKIPVTLFCDESHILFGNKEMSQVIYKFLTMGRSLNVASVLGSQGTGHFPKDIAQYVSSKFMFKSSVEEAKKFLEMFNTAKGSSDSRLDVDAVVQSVADFKTSGNCFMMDCLNRSGLVHINSNYDTGLLTSNPFKQDYEDSTDVEIEDDSIASISGGVFRE